MVSRAKREVVERLRNMAYRPMSKDDEVSMVAIQQRLASMALNQQNQGNRYDMRAGQQAYAPGFPLPKPWSRRFWSDESWAVALRLVLYGLIGYGITALILRASSR